MLHLDPDQQRAVDADAPFLAVVAGAGAGKTRVLVARVCRLLRDGTLPERILVVTFTHAAADELRARIGAATDAATAAAITIGTFHGVAYALIQAHPEWANRRPGWDLWTDAEVEAAAADAARDVGAKVHKLRGTGRADVARTLSPPAVRFAYIRAMTAANALDYDALEGAFLSAAARGLIGDLWHEVLVDEVQDVSPAQAEIVECLECPGPGATRITVVGDPRQSIYRFRGADPRVLQRWLASPGVTTVHLARNYRSGDAIVSAGNALSRAMTLGLPDVEAAGECGAWAAVVPECADEGATVAEIVTAHGRDPGTVAIIGRTWRHLEQIADALSRARVPWQYMRRESATSSRAAAVFDAGCRCAVSPGNDAAVVALLRALRIPESEIDRYRGRAARRRQPLIYVATEIKEIIRGINASTSTDLAAVHFVRAAGFSPAAGSTVFDRVDAWTAARAKDGRSVSVADWLAYGAGLSRDEPAAKPDGAVALVTAHGAKGLEWPCVVVVGAAEGIWPSARSARNPEDVEEERRLFYVAITRAERELYVTWPREREPWPGAMPDACRASRYVAELNGQE